MTKITCNNCNNTVEFYMAIDIWSKVDDKHYCLKCSETLEVGWYKEKTKPKQ